MAEPARDAIPPPERILGVELSGRTLAQIFAGLLIAVLVTVFIAPRTAPFLVGILGLASIPLLAQRGFRLAELPWRDPLVLVVMAFAAYAFASALWAADPAEATKLSALFALCVALTVAAMSWLRQEEGERLSRLGLSLLIGFGFGAAYLAFELSTGLAFKRLLFNTIELARPEGTKNLRLKEGFVTFVHANTLNRNVAVLLLLLFPALFAASRWPQPGLRRALPVLLGGVAILAIILSQHESSKLALAGGAAVYILHAIVPGLTWRLLQIGWVVVVLGIVPLALAAHHAGLHEAGWIQSTGQARIAIWGVTARETLKSPIIGIGAASTKAVDEQAKAELKAAGSGIEEGQAGGAELFAHRTGRHAHNVYLQTWFELGAVGALLLLAAGWFLISRLSQLPERARPYAAATFATGASLAGFSWGFWQPWFMPAFMLAGLMLLLAVRVAEKDALGFFRQQ